MPKPHYISTSYTLAADGSGALRFRSESQEFYPVGFGQTPRSPTLRHIPIQISLYPLVESYLLLVELVGREFDFNKKEPIPSVYNEEVWRLRVRLTDKICRILAEYANSLKIRRSFPSPTPVFPCHFVTTAHIVDGTKQFSETIGLAFQRGHLTGICFVVASHARLSKNMVVCPYCFFQRP
jgi:hypothetical protein